MVKFLVICAGFLAIPGVVIAQPTLTPATDHFIQGSWFADFRRWDWPGTPQANGGSIAIGRIRGPGKTFELEIYIPQSADWYSEHIGPGGPAGTDAPLLGSRRWQQSRIVSMALLWGFSKKAEVRRVTAEWLVGFGAHVSQKRFRDETWRVDTPAEIHVDTESTYGAAPTGVVGINGRIRMSRRIEIVPNARLFIGYGGEGWIVLILRPGVGARVTF